MAVRHGDDVGARLALDVQDHGEGVVLENAPSWLFSAPSTTVATSFNRIAAPLR